MTEVIQRSFTGGELAPSLRSRADLNKYAQGLALCENMFIRSQGGIYSRPGGLFIGDLGSEKAELISFRFNTDQTYILVFQHLKMRVVRNGGFVLLPDNVTQYELVTPYTESELERLIFTQDADVMTITHPNHDPTTLSRLDHDDWTLAAIDYLPSVATPAIISTTPNGLGAGDTNKTYKYVITAVDKNGVESLPSEPVTEITKSLSTTAGITLRWTPDSSIDYYRVYKDPSIDSRVYGWIGDSKTDQFTDFNIAPITSDSPPESRTPFEGSGNKPATVGYYQQRQIFANTNNAKQTVFTTQTGIYDSLRGSVPARDDDAITFTIKSTKVDEIRHILDLNALIVLTAGAEGKITEGQNEVLIPSTVGYRTQTRNGASWVRPAVVDDTVLYVQEKGTKIRDLRYAFADDKYSGSDLSIMAEHLFADHTIKQLAYSEEPYGILWAIRDDGVLLGLTYQREHQVWAWHQHSTKGKYGSIASISEDGRDAVYYTVERVINGETRQYLERFEKRVDTVPEDVFCVDSGLRYEGPAITDIGGISHLEGEEVAVVADGVEVKGLVVQNGIVTLPRPASKISLGLAFTPAFETLDLDVQLRNGTMHAREVSVSKVTLDMQRSRGGWVGPKLDNGSTGGMEEIRPRDDVDGYAEVVLKTQQVELHIQPEWGYRGGIRVEQRSPFPFAVLAVTPNVDIG